MPVAHELLLRSPERAVEIELTSVPSGAQLGPSFSPDEPAKVHMASVGGDYAREAARHDVEKECLYLENAALKEALLQQKHQQQQPHQHQQQNQQQNQQSMNWLWTTPSDWSPSHDSYDPWAMQACLQPGAEVVFQGLKSAVDLNGQHAVVERWDEASERWVVRLPSGEDKFAKPQNLTPVYPSWSAFNGVQQPWAWQGYADCYDSARQPGGRSRRGSGTLGGTMKTSSPCTSFISNASDTTASGKTLTSSFSSCESWDCGAGVSDDMKTTVMMRNIPNDYTREMLLKLLDQEGFQGSYDLVYLPIDYHSKVGFGYAFINLVSHAEAERFRTHFTDFAKWEVVSQKVCEVCWSSVLQGVQAHIDRYRSSPVMHEAVRDEFKPVLFENGKRIPFPGPTKSIRAPRARRRDSK